MTERACPFPPCAAIVNVTVYLAQPKDTVPSLPIIDPHTIVYAGRDTGETCPASLMRLPLSQHNIDLLGQRYEVWRRRRPQENDATERAAGLREHVLTPHPIQGNQWFVHEPKEAAVASAGEIKANIAGANLELAVGIEHARRAAERFAAAKAILGGVRQDTRQEIGLLLAGEAIAAAEDATRYGLASIELNSAFGNSL